MMLVSVIGRGPSEHATYLATSQSGPPVGRWLPSMTAETVPKPQRYNRQTMHDYIGTTKTAGWSERRQTLAALKNTHKHELKQS
jgi:hypothetical protein